MTTTSSVATDSVFESSTNPRKRYERIEELAESIRAYGVLQPILVRPSDGRYECVFGHRRLRAAKLAGLEVIPATIRELTDSEVLEAQLVENCQRQDIHPLEEGAAYHELHETLGYSVEEIAAKVGKSKATVYARMKLCSLCEPGRKALLDGKLDASVAVLIARIPNEKLQAEATKKLLEPYMGGNEPRTYRQAAELVQREYMLQLADAPFAPRDAELVPEAGACTVCPKRTGAQPELFADIGRADVCTDTVCFARKRDAAWEKRAKEAKEKGLPVMPAKEAKTAFGYGGRPVGDWLEWTEKTWTGDQHVSPKALAKKTGKELAVVLARDPHGGIHELVSRRAFEAIARKVVKQARGGEEGGRPGESDEARKERERWKREQEVRELVHRREVELIVASLEKKANDAAWFAIFDHVFDTSHVSYGKEAELIIARRGLKPGKDDVIDEYEILRGAFVAATIPGRLAMLVEMVIGDAPEDKHEDGLVKACGIDRKKLEAEVKAELKEKRHAEAAEQKAKVKGDKAPATKTKRRVVSGVCRECGCTDDAACPGGCCWTDEEQTVCSSCA